MATVEAPPVLSVRSRRKAAARATAIVAAAVREEMDDTPLDSEDESHSDNSSSNRSSGSASGRDSGGRAGKPPRRRYSLTNSRVRKLDSDDDDYKDDSETTTRRSSPSSSQKKSKKKSGGGIGMPGRYQPKAKTALGQYAVQYLKNWMLSPEHIEHPYPTEDEKIEIMEDTGLELKQLTNWFVNNRKRYWRPKVDELKRRSHSMPGRPSISKLAAQEAKGRPELVRPANQPKPTVHPSKSKSSENQTTSNTATIRPASGGGKTLKRKSSKGSKKGSSAPRSKKSRVTTDDAVVVSAVGVATASKPGRVRRIPSGRVSADGQTVVGPARGGGKHLTRLISSCSTSTVTTSPPSVYSGPTGFREAPSLAESSASFALLSDDEPSAHFAPVSNPLSGMSDPVVDPLQSAMARAAAASVEIPQQLRPSQVVCEEHSQEDMGQIVDQDGIVVEDDVPDFNFTFPSEEGQADDDCDAEESSADAIKKEEIVEAKPATVTSVNEVVEDKPMAVVQSVAKRTLERDPAKDIQCSAVPHSCDEGDAQPCALCAACRDWNLGTFSPWELTVTDHDEEYRPVVENCPKVGAGPDAAARQACEKSSLDGSEDTSDSSLPGVQPSDVAVPLVISRVQSTSDFMTSVNMDNWE
mmetsp:Transcript_36600/g.82311  ORF Transcript_36600/g.82311 Transcript_36600/m.82311 type:complete len:639 (-) Transcript_36600:326-2242(-)